MFSCSIGYVKGDLRKKKKKPGIPGTAKVVLNLGRDMHHWTGMFLEVITWGLGMDSKGINMKGNNISD